MRPLLVCLLFSAVAGPATADELVHRRGEGLRQRVSWSHENDWLFADRGYTNGVALTWLGEEVTADASPTFAFLARVTNLALIPMGTVVDRGQFGLRAGQVMYTPRRFWSPHLLSGDQPFAGWGYVGGVLRLVGTRDTVELSVVGGPLGPASLAGQTQELTHRYIVPWSPQPRGWRYQTSAGIGLMAQGRWEHSYLVVDGPHWRYFDLRSLVDVRAGTVFDTVTVGGEARVGLFGRHQATGRLDPAALEALLSPTWAEVAGAALEDLQLWVHFGAAPRVVLYNAMIGGTLFTKNTHVVPFHRGVFEVSGGLGVQAWILRGEAALVLHTPEAVVRGDDGQAHWRLRLGFAW